MCPSTTLAVLQAVHSASNVLLPLPHWKNSYASINTPTTSIFLSEFSEFLQCWECSVLRLHSHICLANTPCSMICLITSLSFFRDHMCLSLSFPPSTVLRPYYMVNKGLLNKWMKNPDRLMVHSACSWDTHLQKNWNVLKLLS